MEPVDARQLRARSRKIAASPDLGPVREPERQCRPGLPRRLEGPFSQDTVPRPRRVRGDGLDGAALGLLEALPGFCVADPRTQPVTAVEARDARDLVAGREVLDLGLGRRDDPGQDLLGHGRRRGRRLKDHGVAVVFPDGDARHRAAQLRNGSSCVKFDFHTGQTATRAVRASLENQWAAYVQISGRPRALIFPQFAGPCVSRRPPRGPLTLQPLRGSRRRSVICARRRRRRAPLAIQV